MSGENAVFIVRLENVKRVLLAMDPHEREKHFDMGLWGIQNSCGTVGCAAGLSSLDPWFQENGFKGRMATYQSVVDNQPTGYIELWDEELNGWGPFYGYRIAQFFGDHGHRIFCDDRRRSVEQVVGEIDAAIEEMRREPSREE